MARGSLRRFDVQASYGFVLGILSVVPLLAAAYLVWRNWDGTLRAIVYKTTSNYRYTLLACITAALLVAVIALLFGWSSAGQRRNPNQGRSWVGFFMGSAVASLCVILLYVFMTFCLPLQGG